MPEYMCMHVAQRILQAINYLHTLGLEMSVAQHIKEDLHGSWSCELCNTRSNNIMQIVTHILMCRYSCSTFSTKSAIRICMALEEPRSVEMLGPYDRIAGEETESEVSDLEPETDSEVSENQEFSATPPNSLSSNEKLGWTFRCLLPQINEYRHAVLLMRSEITIIQRDHAITMAFSISNHINNTYGMISRIRPIWATGHAPAPAEVDTLKKTLEVWESG